ncbi:hypothetical protein [Paenibacillus sp. GCM10023250]|uniref:hypothetical protein n=1 Tax=Paenibacillus sp. GCM10023250 TaxID=3252648 RepID=UPI003622C306
MKVAHLNKEGGYVNLSLQADGKAESLIVSKAYADERSEETGGNNGGGGGSGGGGGIGGGGGFGGMVPPPPADERVISKDGKLTLTAGQSGEVSVDDNGRHSGECGEPGIERNDREMDKHA